MKLNWFPSKSRFLSKATNKIMLTASLSKGISRKRNPKEPENGESYLLNDSCTIVQTKDANQTSNRNDNDNYFVVQLREYKGKQSDNFTRFHKQAQTINKILGKTEANFTAEETPKEPGKGESFLLLIRRLLYCCSDKGCKSN